MTKNFTDYSSVRHTDGKTEIFDDRLFATRSRQIHELLEAYQAIREELLQHDFPVTPEWITTAAKGSIDFAMLASNTARQQLVKAGLPQRLIERLAREEKEIPESLALRLDELHNKVNNAADGLPLAPGDIAFNEDGITINEAGITERLEAGCSRQMTKEEMKDAEALKAVVKELRRLRDRGIDIANHIALLIGGDPFDYGFTKWPDIDELELLMVVGPRRLVAPEQYRANVAFANSAKPVAGVGGVAVTELIHPVEEKPQEKEEETI